MEVPIVHESHETTLKTGVGHWIITSDVPARVPTCSCMRASWHLFLHRSVLKVLKFLIRACLRFAATEPAVSEHGYSANGSRHWQRAQRDCVYQSAGRRHGCGPDGFAGYLFSTAHAQPCVSPPACRSSCCRYLGHLCRGLCSRVCQPSHMAEAGLDRPPPLRRRQ